jgi:hypothetical protein
MRDYEAIAQQILALPADLTRQDRNERVIELCKGLDKNERTEVDEQGLRLLLERSPDWKRWQEAETVLAVLDLFDEEEEEIEA